MNSPIPVVKPIRISLLLPAYMVADYLHECLQSIIDQSLQICEEYAQRHPDLLKLIANAETQGVSVAGESRKIAVDVAAPALATIEQKCRAWNIRLMDIMTVDGSGLLSLGRPLKLLLALYQVRRNLNRCQ